MLDARKLSGALSLGSRSKNIAVPRASRGVHNRRQRLNVEARAARYDRRKPPPPDLPSLLFDQRIVYLGMPVNESRIVDLDQARVLSRISFAARACGHRADGRRAPLSGETGQLATHRNAHQLLRDDQTRRRDCGSPETHMARMTVYMPAISRP